MKTTYTVAGALLALSASFAANAQVVVSEDFSRATTTNSWFFYNGACLTASQSAGVLPTGPSTAGLLPGCTSAGVEAYYNENLVGGWNGVAGGATTLPDPLIPAATGPGEGALRLTNGSPGGYHQNGQILSNWSFPSGQGLQITFMTVSYRGDSNGYYNNAVNPGDGADGLSFFLTDASQPFLPGAWGGSLGYTCSNTNPPYDGMEGAYLAVGLDEWGNFLNGSAAMPGWLNPNPNTISGDNTALGYGERPDRIGLRGQGNVNWSYLTATYGTTTAGYNVSPLYPASLATTFSSNGTPYSQLAVQQTCKTGLLYNYANPSAPVQAVSSIVAGAKILVPASDYTPIPGAYAELPETGANAVHIAAEGAMSRQQASPIYYKLKLTEDGLLSFWYSVGGPAGVFLPVIKEQNITAPNSAGVPTNGALPAAFRFGFGGSTGGSNNIHEILCFRAADLSQSASSAGVNEKQSSKIEQGIQAYFGYYDPNNSTGRLTAYGLGTDSTGAIVINPTATWDASCVLTGTGISPCPTTTSTTPVTAEAYTSRVILTQTGQQGAAGGIPFEWANLTNGTPPATTNQQQAMDAGDTAPFTANRVNYLRGQRANEIPTSGPTGTQVYRRRDSVLADIQNSSPAWEGPPEAPYNATWADRLDGTGTMPDASMPENSGTQSYAQYVTAQQQRLNIVYVGANDGMLHGFRSGAFNADGSFNTTAPNDGVEVLAYMPNTVLQFIHDAVNPGTGAIDPTLDYSSPQYGHNFYVDATPGTGDLFYNGQWHTWLVSGLGAGGAAIYALDITNPTNFSEANAATLVVGEWTSGNIKCAGEVAAPFCGSNLGNTYGTPQIRRLHNGQWAAIFGNGVGSSTGDAGIYVMLIDKVDPLNNAPTFYYLSTKTGSSASPNGIGYLAPVDLDGDHITDYVYAGDLQGNMWRFDLTSPTPSGATPWAVTAGGPLFKTQSGQPITTAAVVASGLAGSTQQRLMVIFGTGQKTSATNQTALAYASGAQDLYGVWDWNMGTWDSKSTAQYTSLAALPTSVTAPLHQANLAGETVTINTTTGPQLGDRDIASNANICWAGTTTCSPATSDVQFGWYLPLPGTTAINGTTSSNEQIIYNPQLIGPAVVVNSLLPANNAPTSCAINADQGWTYGVSALTGGAFTNSFPFYNDTIAAGVQTNATGSSFPISNSSGVTYLVYQTVLNTHGVTQFNTPANSKAKRLTWVERR